jgi:biotin-(acetyl-CoA carboxylase) ligase
MTEATANAELAMAIRHLNARLSQMDPERIAEILPAWQASWDKLSLHRERATNRGEAIDAVAAWEQEWSQRLASPSR